MDFVLFSRRTTMSPQPYGYRYTGGPRSCPHESVHAELRIYWRSWRSPVRAICASIYASQVRRRTLRHTVASGSYAPLSGIRRLDQLKQGNQIRQIFLNRLPNDIEVDVKVRMHESVSHTDEFIPRNIRQLLACCLGHPSRSLTDDFDLLHQRHDELAVRVQVPAGSTGSEGCGLPSGIHHMA